MHMSNRFTAHLVSYVRPVQQIDVPGLNSVDSVLLTHGIDVPRESPGRLCASLANSAGGRRERSLAYPHGVPDRDDSTLSTERLILRRWKDRDRAPFARMNADPEVMRYFVRPLAGPESDALVDRIEAQFEERGFGLWAVERREDAAFLGFTGLATTVSLGFTGQASAALGTPLVPEAEVGWRFDRTAWGQGYATEAARAALRFGFDVVDLPEIVSFTTPLNVASRRVMERLGMHRDPAEDFDHPRIPEGNPLRRHVLYRLTRAEFRGTPD